MYEQNSAPKGQSINPWLTEGGLPFQMLSNVSVCHFYTPTRLQFGSLVVMALGEANQEIWNTYQVNHLRTRN